MSTDNSQQQQIVSLQTISNLFFADIVTKNTLDLVRKMKTGFNLKNGLTIEPKPISKKTMADIFTVTQQIETQNLKISNIITKIRMYESFINDLGTITSKLTPEEMDKITKQVESFTEQREVLFSKKIEVERGLIDLYTKHREIIAYDILGLKKDDYEQNTSDYKDIVDAIIFAYDNRLLNIEITDEIYQILLEQHKRANKIFVNENKRMENT